MIKFVECYWLIEKTSTDILVDFPKLNPDPNGCIIITDSEQHYHMTGENRCHKVTGNHLVLPYTHTYQLDHRSPFLMVGIKLKIDALYKLKIPSDKPKLNQVVEIELSDLIDSHSFTKASLLAPHKNSPDKICNILDSGLLPWFSQHKGDKHTSLISRATKLMHNIPISGLGHALGCSQRTLERSFLRVTSLTLKQYDSMNKLEKILGYLYKLENESVDWADIALAFDFCDQPHLIRYLKSILGYTPGQYVKQRDLTIDAYGNFD